MLVDGEDIVGVASNVDHSETVAFASRDCDDGQRTCTIRPLTTQAVDEGRRRSRHGGTLTSEGMIPVSKGDDSRFIINIVEASMRIVGVVDDHRSSEAITILGLEMAVIPERPSLIGAIEVVQECMPGGNRALVHERNTICPVRSSLEETMPVNGSGLQHVFVGELIDDIDLELIALVANDERTGEDSFRKHSRTREAVGGDIGVDDMEVSNRTNRRQNSK